MNSRDAESGQIALDGLPFDGIALGAAPFWQPNETEASPFLGQVPLLFWLVQVCRPGMVLGLGLRAASGYFALCQAIATLDLPSRAWGFGTWEHEGSGLWLPEGLRARNARDHAGMSRLARVPDPVVALKRFAPDMFDLILLDVTAPVGGDEELTDLLVQAMSPRGVLLLQGGDMALLTRLATRFPLLRFAAHGGLAVVLAGPKPPPLLAQLAGLAPDAPRLASLQAVFARLGQSLEDAAHLQEIAGQLAQAQAALAVPGQAIAPPPPLDRTNEKTAAELATLRHALDEGHLLRLRETRLLTEELERLTEELHQLRAEAATLRSHADQAATEAARAAAQAAEAELSALRIRHFDEMEDLRSELDWATRALEASRATADQAATEQARLTAQLATQTKAAQVARAQLDKLKGETARRDATRLVQLKLRDWQLHWLSAQGGRMGRRVGPSGGALVQEIAAVAGHPLFNADWYRASYPDLRDSPLPPSEHFLRHGLFEGRNPGPDFNTLAWFAANPEALSARQNPLLIADLQPQRL